MGILDSIEMEIRLFIFKVNKIVEYVKMYFKWCSTWTRQFEIKLKTKSR